MAEEFNAGDLRQLAEDVETLEGSAGRASALEASAADALPNPCAVYRDTLRGPLLTVQRIVCNPLVKRIIGSTPCSVIEQVIKLLDRLCPGT